MGFSLGAVLENIFLAFLAQKKILTKSADIAPGMHYCQYFYSFALKLQLKKAISAPLTSRTCESLNIGFMTATEVNGGCGIGFYEMESEDKWYYIKPNHHGFTIPGDHWKPSDRSGRKNFNLQQLNDALENVCQVIENKNQYY